VTSKITEVTQTSANNYMKKKEHGRIKHLSAIRHPRTTTQQAIMRCKVN